MTLSAAALAAHPSRGTLQNSDTSEFRPFAEAPTLFYPCGFASTVQRSECVMMINLQLDSESRCGLIQSGRDWEAPRSTRSRIDSTELLFLVVGQQTVFSENKVKTRLWLSFKSVSVDLRCGFLPPRRMKDGRAQKKRKSEVQRKCQQPPWATRVVSAWSHTRAQMCTHTRVLQWWRGLREAERLISYRGVKLKGCLAHQFLAVFRQSPPCCGFFIPVWRKKPLVI